MKRVLKVWVIFCSVVLMACGDAKQSPVGFSLPEGNAQAGKATFVELACNACHSTPDVAQLEAEPPGDIAVPLGGDVRTVKTYADLVTSVINPSHRFSIAVPTEMAMRDGKSRMRNYNNVMTVVQLIDVVTYLQPHYVLRPYVPTKYRLYHP